MELHHFSQSVLTWHPPRPLVTVNYVLLLYVVAEHLHLFFLFGNFLHQSEGRIKPYLAANTVKRGSLKFLRKTESLIQIPYKKLRTILLLFLSYNWIKNEFCNQIFVVFSFWHFWTGFSEFLESNEIVCYAFLCASVSSPIFCLKFSVKFHRNCL